VHGVSLRLISYSYALSGIIAQNLLPIKLDFSLEDRSLLPAVIILEGTLMVCVHITPVEAR